MTRYADEVYYKCDLCCKTADKDEVHSWWSNIDGKDVCKSCIETVQQVEWNRLLIPIAALIRLEMLGYTTGRTKKYKGSTKTKSTQSLIDELQTEANDRLKELTGETK